MDIYRFHTTIMHQRRRRRNRNLLLLFKPRYKKYSGAASRNEAVLVCSGLLMNTDTHECFLNERRLSLTPTEFSILRILCENRGKVVSSEQLFHAIWGDEYFSKSNNTVTVHIRHLREKMNDAVDNPKYIKTVWGIGYKIETQG